jgi:hypothetical protein
LEHISDRAPPELFVLSATTLYASLTSALEIQMPRFYFHFRKGDEFIIDDEGLDLPVARELLADVI